MPRAKGPAQPPKAAQGLPYGQGQQMQDAQRAIPLPDNRKATSQAIGQPASPSPAPSPGGGGGSPLDQAVAAAAIAPDPTGGLASPSTRPDEPITAGLPIGPGAGPEALARAKAQKASVASFFAIAAETFGNDPVLAAMAQRAQRRGL